MKFSRKITIIILFSIFLLIPYTVRAGIKSHPLSEIYPTDTNLNMSNGTISYNITDVGVINPSNNLKVGSKLILEGNLDINGNNIENPSEIVNFFSEACGEGKVVDRIYSNGSYSCIAVDKEITDIWVNQTGDTMEGVLNMSNHPIVNLTDPAQDQDAATKAYVDLKSTTVNESATQRLEEVLEQGNEAGTYNIDMSGNNITSISYINPSLPLSIGSPLSIVGDTNLNSFDLYGVNYINASEFYDNEESLTSKYLDVSGDSMEGTLDFGNNSFAITNSSKIANLNADLLDGVELSNIDWGVVSMEQTDINLSDVGSANTNLNMNDYNITNIAHLLNYFDSACPPGSALYNIQENGSFECISISEETHELYVNEGGDAMTGNLSLGGHNISDVNLVDGIDLENPGTGIELVGNRYEAILGENITTSELIGGSVTNPKISLDSINSSQVMFNYSDSPYKGGPASNALQLNGQPSIYYLNETTNAGGDLSGNFGNLQLGSGVVDSNEIASNSVSNNELDNLDSFTLAELIVSDRLEVQGDLDVFGNITNTEVNHLNVNGSLLPPERYNNTFNIGNRSRQWKDLYIADDIHVGGYVDGIDLSKAGDGLGISGNQYYVKNETGISVTSDGVMHQDTSSQGSVSNGGAIVIQNITLDQFGHIKEIDPKNLNVIYYTKSDASSLFVNKTGDTMDGELKMNDDIDLNGNSIKSTGGEVCIGNECN